MIEGQLDLAAIGQAQPPGLAPEIGAELRSQPILQSPQIAPLRPDLGRERRQLRPLPLERQIVFRALMQTAHRLTGTLDGLFVPAILGPHPQATLPAPQGSFLGVEIGVAQLPVGHRQWGIGRQFLRQLRAEVAIG